MIGYLAKNFDNKKELINQIAKNNYSAKISDIFPSDKLKDYRIFVDVEFLLKIKWG